jgi:hypothetical protein
VRDRGEGADWKLVDDSDLDHVHPPRRETIGARSEPMAEPESRSSIFPASLWRSPIPLQRTTRG